MDDALLTAVLERLDDADRSLSPGTADLVVAALEGAEALAQAVGGTTRPRLDARAAGPTEAPALAYLRAIAVEGFRGIGEARTLELRPGPGLTVVVGRNGSGKSSFAEAAEIAITGSLRRWDARSAVWREGWRNLHHGGACQVVVELAVEGHPGTTSVRRSWTGDKLDEGETVVQLAGEKRTTMARLGWEEALANYRPFLTHLELEAMLAKPSELFETLAQVLGLDDLVEAGRRLSEALKAETQVAAAARKELPELLARLEAVDDERAARCRAALSGRAWDLDRAEATATGTHDAEAPSPVHLFQGIAQLRAPDAETVSRAAERLRSASEALAAASSAQAEDADRLANLLAAALDHHQHHGDGDCPVCGQAGAIDSSWRAAVEVEVTRLRAAATGLKDARAEAGESARGVRSLIQPVPALLRDAAAAGLPTNDASRAWLAWASPPSGDDPVGLEALAEHLESAWPDLAGSLQDLARRGADEAAKREYAWAPAAAAVAAWCASARRSLEAKPAAERLKEADAWLKAVTEDLRNERLRPLAARAGDVWAKLRQESNVELGGISLAGTATRRRVEVTVNVDGARGAALGVMSQGEINALALSIFIPRATLPTSPFGFLLIDDPVQAMDPAKVEGLARVLEETARSRQVVVFTHDDRLPAAIRRLDIDAVVIEVMRRPGSIVELVPGDDPATRSLEQAWALCLDQHLPPELVRRVVPGLCRTAVETVLVDEARRRLLDGGERHAEVERRIDGARSLMERAALALFGDKNRAGQVYSRLNTHGTWAANTFRACNEGAHGSYAGDSQELVQDTRRLVTKLRQVRG